MNWTKEQVIKQLQQINSKGFIPVPENMFRTDDGIVSQILEREFGIQENNLNLADLGSFELKGMRYKKNKPNKLTLFHQASSDGLTSIQIFDRFGYTCKSNHSDILKKKLFTTIRGNKYNNLGFILKTHNETRICLYYQDEYIAAWDLSSVKNKINHTILVFADTIGGTNSKDEKFHYIKAYLLDGITSLADAICNGTILMELCIDQPADGSRSPHDRGPHIQIPISQLHLLFKTVEQIL